MKRLVILGATGSIGTTCLNSLRTHSLPIEVVGLTADKNHSRLSSLEEEFKCPVLHTNGSIEKSGLDEFLDKTHPDIVLNAIAGFSGLYATKCTLEHSIDIALANKESVVSGASFIFNDAEKYNARIIPVDSEHSALYNLLKKRKAEKLVITASGGPFVDRKDLSGIKKEDALKHPTWKMGEKITIDSATLANKGLEVIEASYLFSFKPEDIEVVVHRQSVVHSLIRTKEGAVYAQLSPPDMALPIISAILEEDLDESNIVSPLSFDSLTLTFEKPDLVRFPLLGEAYRALSYGYAGPVIYNAADEVAVAHFINGDIAFTEIADVVKKSLDNENLRSALPSSYETVLSLDRETRLYAERIIKDRKWK